MNGTRGHNAFLIPQEEAGVCESSNFRAFTTTGRKWSLPHLHCYFSILSNWVTAKFTATLMLILQCLHDYTDIHCVLVKQKATLPFKNYIKLLWTTQLLCLRKSNHPCDPEISTHFQEDSLLLASAASWHLGPSHPVLASCHQDSDVKSTTSTVSMHTTSSKEHALKLGRRTQRVIVLAV